MQYIFLSHDVDWRKQGPPLEHVLSRKDRFDESVLAKLPDTNPYYNFPEYMELEEKFNVKSTFFFRTIYENGTFLDYENEITDLKNGGWEIGLHTDPSSVNDVEKIKQEKIKLEKLLKSKINGNRVHFLGYDDDLPKKLKELGFSYDSSVRNSKDKIDEHEMGFKKIDGIIEFPITLMDAYLFTYMKMKEENIVSTFENTLKISRKMNNDFNVITVIWHDNVLKMKGGRVYSKILEFLTSQDDVKICRGIDLYNRLV